MCLDLRIGLYADIVRPLNRGVDSQVLLGDLLVSRLTVVNKRVEVHSKDLEVLLGRLKLVHHLVSGVKGYILLTTEVKEGLVLLLEFKLVGPAYILLVEVGWVGREL